MDMNIVPYKRESKLGTTLKLTALSLVVLIGLPCILCSLVLTPGLFVSSRVNALPVYPGATSVERSGLFEGFTSTAVGRVSFFASDQPSIVLNYYDILLREQGWTFARSDIDQLSSSGAGSLEFTRNTEEINITVINYKGMTGCTIVLEK